MFPVKLAAVKVYAGTVLATNTSGFAGPLGASYNTALLGVAEDTVDNSGGVAGDKSVNVRRSCAFALGNNGTNAVAQADIGKKPGFIDDNLVNNGTTPTLNPASAAEARIEEIDSDGAVWVYIN